MCFQHFVVLENFDPDASSNDHVPGLLPRAQVGLAGEKRRKKMKRRKRRRE
jgi:hypothetical protein